MDTPPFDSPHVALVRRNRYLLPAGLLMLLLGPAGILAAKLLGAPFLIAFAIPTAALGLFLAIFSEVTNPWTRDVPCRMEASSAGVFIDGELVTQRSDILAGFVVPDSPRAPRVRLERRFQRPLEVRVNDDEQGRELLRALGLDATQTSASFILPSRAMSETAWSVPIMLAFAVVYLAVGIFGPYGRLGATPLLLFFALFGTLSRTKLVVGADGIFRAWLWKKEFFGYGEVAKVTTFSDRSVWSKSNWQGIELALRSGGTVRFPVTQQSSFDDPRVRLIAQRIHEARQSHDQGDGAAEAALLRRNDRSVADWLVALRAIGTGAHVDHRTAPVVPETLWRIVEDPRAPPGARAGAAVALKASQAEGASVRIRAAAAAMAQPKVRIALECAAGEEEEALRDALAEVEAEAGAARVER